VVSAARSLDGRESWFRGVATGCRLERVEDLVLRNVVVEPEK
jgi:hypothetical protein